MRKFFSAFLAVVLAISFSAYTTIQKKAATGEKTTNYYYYKLNSAGTQLSIELSPTPISKAAAKTAAGCTDNASAPICAYGLAYRITSLPVDIPGDFSEYFKKSN